ncbi:MAG: ATP-dependent helicase HrpB [Spartobacteria bacterium]|nr:ATP-dependent helicase HrpB [Spartobacteria bacterium]
MAKLPVAEVRDALCDALQTCGRAVVSAPTGSGKSTQIPQYVLDDGLAGESQVVVLQPRRIAARMLAKRVAEERGGSPGSEIGYQVRLENVVSERTRIRYITEGVLLRECLMDPFLSHIGVLIFDEFHERHLTGDVALALAMRLLQTDRPDLKIIVMSATLHTDRLLSYLEPCPLIESSGRMFPVDMQYLPKKAPSQEAIWDTAAQVIRRREDSLGSGVLVFMPGIYEINKTVQALRQAVSGWKICALHGELPLHEQDAAVNPCRERKIVVATNVAETSITVDGITAVVDCGLARVARYDPVRAMDTLFIEKISRASADQRAGRAGRTAPGICYRLWTEYEQKGRPAFETPEIHRTDLAETLLSLKALGMASLDDVPWFESPSEVQTAQALQFLCDIGAIDAQEQVTDVGRSMLTYPLHPRYARMMLEAMRRNCAGPVSVIAALSQGRDILIRNPGSAAKEMRERVLGEKMSSDFFVRVAAMHFARDAGFRREKCEALGIHAFACQQAWQLAQRFMNMTRLRSDADCSVHAGNERDVRRCIFAGFADRLACRVDHGSLRCLVIHGRKGELSRDCAVQDGRLFVSADMAEIGRKKGSSSVSLSLITAVEEDWLQEMAPQSMMFRRIPFYDAVLKSVRIENRRAFHDLVLESSVRDDATPDESAAMLAAEIVQGRCKLQQWNAAVEQWIERVNFVSKTFPEWDIPPFDDEARQMVLEQLCMHATRLREVQTRPVLPVVKAWLSAAQHAAVNHAAPTHLILHSGRKIPIQYDAVNAPTVRVVIQQLFGMDTSPLIADGRARLRFDILAPNQRSVQITDDLASFWATRYPDLKKELSRKYYKHEWR